MFVLCALIKCCDFHDLIYIFLDNEWSYDYSEASGLTVSFYCSVLRNLF